MPSATAPLLRCSLALGWHPASGGPVYRAFQRLRRSALEVDRDPGPSSARDLVVVYAATTGWTAQGRGEMTSRTHK
jgi:hypothetical protein